MWFCLGLCFFVGIMDDKTQDITYFLVYDDYEQDEMSLYLRNEIKSKINV